MERVDNGPCDFLYFRGLKQGRRCGRPGTRDTVGYRCKNHRICRIKSWHRSKDGAAYTMRSTYEDLIDQISRLKERLALIKKLTADLPLDPTPQQN